MPNMSVCFPSSLKLKILALHTMDNQLALALKQNCYLHSAPSKMLIAIIHS